MGGFWRTSKSALGGMAEELDRIDFENLSEPFEHVDRSGMLFPFEHPDVIAIDARTIGKLLLRHRFGVSYLSQISGDDLPQTHAERSPASLLYYHLVN